MVICRECGLAFRHADYVEARLAYDAHVCEGAARRQRIAHELRAEGQDTVERHADGVVELLRDAALRIARERGSVTADDLRAWAEQNGVTVHHPNVWGAVFRTGFRKVAQTTSGQAQGHGNVVWRWVAA